MNLISKKVTYELTKAELETTLIEMVRAKGLAKAEQKVSVEFDIGSFGDDRFNGGYSSYALSKVKITVEG